LKWSDSSQGVRAAHCMAQQLDLSSSVGLPVAQEEGATLRWCFRGERNELNVDNFQT